MTIQSSESRSMPRAARAFGPILLALFMLTPVGGCALFGKHPTSAAVTPAPPPSIAAIKPKKAPPRDSGPADIAPPDNPAPVKTALIDPHTLLGLDPESVQKKLGAPTRMQNTALSHEWVYAAPGCSFSIFFYPNVNSTTFRALKYGSAKDDGQSLDSSDACVRKLLTVRIDAD